MPILQMGELSLESSEVALLVSGRAGMKAACFQDRNPFLSDGQSPGMSLRVRVLKKNMSQLQWFVGPGWFFAFSSV